MDIGRAFKYVFEDKDWLKKVLIGGVLNIIPVIGQAFTMGYGLRQLRKQRSGQELPLPDWDDWGGDFQRGIMVVVGYLGYAVPLIILAIISSIFASIGASTAARGNGGGVWLVCNGIITFIGVIYGIAYAIWMPAALANYAKEDSLGSFFRFDDVWSIIKNNTKEYITLVLMSLVASVVAAIAGTILCGIGNLFTTFIATLVYMHLLAQFMDTVWGASTPFGSVPPSAPSVDNSFQIPQ